MATYSSRVLAGADDGYWAGSWSNNSSSGGIGANFFGNDVYSAWRFNNVTIPQGAVITSAVLTLKASETKSDNITFKVFGIDEDDTADFSSDPGGRSKTTANADWNINGQTIETEYTKDVTAIVQEIIDRGGWASGNDLGLITQNNGSANDKIGRFYSYDGASGKAALLEITYGTDSPSASPYPSLSLSPSASISPSASRSPSVSVSPSISRSPSPSPEDTAFVVEIAKSGIDVLNTNSPQDLKFSSRYGTLKYFAKVNQVIQADGNAGDFAAKGIYTHNLGYKPYVEVFARTYIGSPSGNYEYCPLFGSGASVAYNLSYIVKDNTIEIYGEFIGVSLSTWNFDFLIFVYKNRLTL